MIPNLVLGYLEFIDILVSFPFKITNPNIFPVAKTVLAHITCSNESDSLKFFPTYTPMN